MFGPEPSRIFDYVLHCKHCGVNFAAPVETIPDSWILALCPVCQDKRRYLPTEIFRGRLSQPAGIPARQSWTTPRS